MKRFLFIALFLLFSVAACAEETTGKTSLQLGKKALDNSKYEDAIATLSVAENEYPLLGDYALLWLSEAYHESGNHSESLKAVRSLIIKYPDSPLIKQARSVEIREAAELSDGCAGELFESYLSDYPGEREISYMYAKWLKKHGQQQKARQLFKEIYIKTGAFADLAYSELSPGDIGTEDMLRRASSLLDRLDFKDAESLLRTALSKDDSSMKDAILKKLGFSLFRQKKYLEAAEIYKKAGEKYWELRSLYRARERETVYSHIDEMVSMQDPRIASLLIAIAADKRREGNTREALDLYQRVLEAFPRDREETLWGIGWTYYLSGEYAESADIFGKLNSMHNDPQYLYWQARSLDSAGKDTKGLYPGESRKERDFYSLLSRARTRELWQGPEAKTLQKIIGDQIPTKVSSPSFKKMDRIDVLLEFGLSREAVAEMTHLSKQTSSLEDIVSLCAKFETLGKYNHSVRLAAKAPFSEQLQRFLYPLAYWDAVVLLAERYEIDPFLVLAIIREESRFNVEARSPAGALGLMQLMPQTAYRLDKTLQLGIHTAQNVFPVKNNLHLGISYLSRLIKEFGSYAHAIAAYNAGEEAVRRWNRNGKYKAVDEFIEDIPYPETRNYVKRVLTSFFEYNRIFSASAKEHSESLEKL